MSDSRILRQILTLPVRKSGNKYWSSREIEMTEMSEMSEIITTTTTMIQITSITGKIVVSSFSLLIFNLLTQQQIIAMTLTNIGALNVPNFVEISNFRGWDEDGWRDTGGRDWYDRSGGSWDRRQYSSSYYDNNYDNSYYRSVKNENLT